MVMSNGNREKKNKSSLQGVDRRYFVRSNFEEEENRDTITQFSIIHGQVGIEICRKTLARNRFKFFFPGRGGDKASLINVLLSFKGLVPKIKLKT